MSYRVIVWPQAESDIAAASDWYDEQRAGLGREFTDEISRSIREISENPLRFASVLKSREIRRALTRRFPYRIYFLRNANTAIVFRVLHTSRHDREWKSHIVDV